MGFGIAMGKLVLSGHVDEVVDTVEANLRMSDGVFRLGDLFKDTGAGRGLEVTRICSSDLKKILNENHPGWVARRR